MNTGGCSGEYASQVNVSTFTSVRRAMEMMQLCGSGALRCNKYTKLTHVYFCPV